MNILIVSGFYFPYNNGGPSNTSYWMARALGAKGFSVKVVALHKNMSVPANRWIATEYGSVIYVSFKNVNFAFSYIWTAIKEISTADIIHLNSLFAPTSFLIGIVAAMRRKKLYWSPRGELSMFALRFSSIRKKLQIWVLHQVFRNITFHATSHREDQDIRAVFGPSVRTTIVPNLLELTNPTTRSAESYLLFVGRIHPIKRLDNLIDALANCTNFRSSSFVFKIAGLPSPYKSILSKKIDQLALSDKVTFVGHFAGEEKDKLYANAYYLILPSDSENFGNVVVESLAQGTPVIASTGTPWELLEISNAGFWVENTVESLKNVIDSILLMCEADYLKQRTNARMLVEEQFDVKYGINQWIKDYTAIDAQN